MGRVEMRGERRLRVTGLRRGSGGVSISVHSEWWGLGWEWWVREAIDGGYGVRVMLFGHWWVRLGFGLRRRRCWVVRMTGRVLLWRGREGK